ncbi:MAG: hypothetical protein WC120_05910 [Parcubacteria group bacterium]
MDTYIDILKSFWQPFSQFWWIILPVAFYFIFEIIWKDFVQNNWLGSLEWTMLEIIPPKDLEKGPKPMESVYQGLCGVLTTFNTFDEWVSGKTTDRFSLELVSLGGEVHFYVRVQKRLYNLVESQIYAQYPGAEIREVEDYMRNFPRVVPNRDWDLWGSDIVLSGPDPFPIRTYDKFEEDITGTMIDPMAGFVELFASVPPGQNLLWQMVIFPEPEPWKKNQMSYVQKVAGREKGESGGILQDLKDIFAHLFSAFLGPVEFPKKAKKEEQPLAFRLTPNETEQLKALEENLSKNTYRVKMRMLNIGLKENFEKTLHTAFFGVLRQFNDLNSNNLKPDNTKTVANFVAVDSRVQTMKRRIYNRYRNRNMDGNKFAFSVTELATVYHLPDMGVMTPALPRVESKKGTPPSNLPIG